MATNWATSFSHYKNRGFKWFFGCSVISLCFFLFPVICQFSKNSLFQKRVHKIGFFNFQCFKLNFENSLFFGLLKHYKNRGFSNFWVFLLLKEKKTGKTKNDNWNLWILGPPHLALNPPYFFLFFFGFSGGFKGQVRWPKGPPHLALNPPYLFLLFFYCVFLVV